MIFATHAGQSFDESFDSGRGFGGLGSSGSTVNEGRNSEGVSSGRNSSSSILSSVTDDLIDGAKTGHSRKIESSRVGMPQMEGRPAQMKYLKCVLVKF